MAQSGQKLSLGVYIFPDVEVLDFAGPFEVFSVASEIIGKEKLEVFTIGDSLNSITSIGNLTVIPAKSFDSVEQLDFLVIPGGDGSKRVIENQDSLNQLNRLIQSSRWTMTVCSGARIPAKLGLLNQQQFCTHHEVYDDILKLSPTSIPIRKSRFVQSGDSLFTAAGISAGIDLALHLVSQTFGNEVFQKTKNYMEYEK